MSCERLLRVLTYHGVGTKVAVPELLFLHKSARLSICFICPKVKDYYGDRVGLLFFGLVLVFFLMFAVFLTVHEKIIRRGFR